MFVSENFIVTYHSDLGGNASPCAGLEAETTVYQTTALTADLTSQPERTDFVRICIKLRHYLVDLYVDSLVNEINNWITSSQIL